MMPLSMSGAGEAQIIKKIGGKEEVRSFLEKLGFVVGGEVTVISEIAGNMIVNVKGARVAIGKDMANMILVLYNICNRLGYSLYDMYDIYNIYNTYNTCINVLYKL